MALFDHVYPYTNLHDINLDWIISVIKSIDPSVIKALQELTPDIVEQVTQAVAEAQGYAISAQSSASESKTAAEEASKDAIEASADAALANADAVRAETAKTGAEAAKAAVDESLTPVNYTMTANTDVLTGVSTNILTRTGKTAIFSLVGQFTGNKSSEYFTQVATTPVPTYAGAQYPYGLCRVVSGASVTWSLCTIQGDTVNVESAVIAKDGILFLYGITYPTA